MDNYQGYEKLFKNRYTDEDEEYRRKDVNAEPLIIFPWNANDRHGRGRHAGYG